MKDRYPSIIRSGTHSLTHQFSKNSKKQIWYITTILKFFGEKVKEPARKKIAGSLQKNSWKLSNFKSFFETNNSLILNFLQRTGTKIDGSLKIQRTARHRFGPVLAVWVGIDA